MGRLSGGLGLAGLLVAAVLSCRIPGFDQSFGGLTKLWQLHHKLGLSAFILLLAHPLLLAFAAAEVSLAAAADSLFSMQPTVLYGWLALLALMAFIAPTFHVFGEPDYQRWKRLHRLAAVVLMFGLLHSLMLGRTLPASWNKLLWGGLGLLALSAMAYRWLFSRYYGRYRYRICNVAAVSDNVVELSLQPLQVPLRYRPGQFIYLTPFASELLAGAGEEHPFTLSSAPSEPVLRLAIKTLGDATKALQSITPGSDVTVEGPYGCFFRQTELKTKGLWIAGGIGIVPFLSYLRHCASQHQAADVQLIYCVQDEQHLLFAPELQQLTAVIEGYHFTPHFFSRHGALDLDFITQHCSDLRARQVWICGPPPLILLSRGIVLGAGVTSGDIVTEEFTLL
ncbi:ferric reductase-like transmembrane domain-containing protein [Rheinheimera sp.]|uniref:ferric reductase-like transmembrane domain-containing protein n=1 Tax=Rheinheimera sp. TaxID=1869214 RepID=UPI00273771D6|nr:ferric reductase-like transmembrane domain-containing protein [Rheinheimera sp.]MDP2715467.1 ferric reductase-like transmembrane domain-containing protein [Rheinheimera sp.]